MFRKTTLLLILALTLTMLFGSFPVAADELVRPAQVTTPTEPDETERVRFEGTIRTITPGVEPEGTITVETVSNAGSLTPVAPITWIVHINADTRIRIGREEGTIADLAVRQRVKVEGILQDDGGVLALRIHVKQEDDAQVGFRGTIIDKPEVAITPLRTLTVQMGSRTITVVTDGNTVIKDAEGNTIRFADLKVGQRIKGKGVLQENGSILASEIEVLEDNGGPGHQRVRFTGRITELPNELIGEWTVETTNTMTVTFSVDVNTKIRPPGVRPKVRDWVKVTAVRREDGTLLALKVHIRSSDHPPRPVEFRGIIERMEGDDPPTVIVVSVLSATDAAGSLVDVLIDNHTRIEGDLQVGAYVKVQGLLLDNRSVLAKLIVVKYPEVEFRGRIESIEGDEWIVAGFTVLTADATITGATPQVGLLAEVKGTQVGPRTVHATEIEVKDPSLEPVKIRGIIAGLPETGEIIGSWTITTEDGNDVSIEVTADTVIDTRHGEVKVDALVRVTALPQDNGTLVARRIKVFESD